MKCTPAVALLTLQAVLGTGCSTRQTPAALHTTAASTAGPRGTSARPVAELRRDLEAIFGAAIMDHGQWAVAVRSVETGERLFERQPHKLMVPASNMKIVTLAAAAQALGWDARFPTTLEAVGPVEAGTLRGDLYVRGGGDPTLNTRGGRGAAVFAGWADALAGAGITRVDGRLIGDDDLFDDEGLGAGWAWDYLQYGYAAPTGALQYNEDAADLLITPGPAAGAPAVVSLSSGSGLTLINKATTSPAGTPETVDFRRPLDRQVLEVVGTVPRPPDPDPASPVRTAGRQVAVVNPTRFFVESLKQALAARGIVIAGQAVDIDDVEAPAAAAERRTIARTESPPLGDIGAVMMKVSQNLYADTLLKSLGVAAGGAGTTAAGRDRVLAILRDWKIDDRALVMADGSGLSRYNYVTADVIATLLERLYADPRHREPFMATLAVAGKEGTVANRLRKTRGEGNARVKTGSISNMRALSGYVRTRDGEALAFSIIANHFTLPAATVNWITDLAVETLANFTRHP